MWVDKNGKNWRIREEVGGKIRTLKSGFPTKKSAELKMASLTVDRARGDFINPQDGKVTVAQWVNTFWPGHRITLKPSSQRSADCYLNRHVLPLLGFYRLDGIDAMVMQDFVRMLYTGDRVDLGDGRQPIKALAPKTVSNIHALVHTILDAAAKARMISANPSSGTRMPPREHIEMQFLTPPEIERLLAACSGDYLGYWRPLIMLLATTGLRYSEATALRVGRVDVFAGTVTVVQSAFQIGPGQFIYTTPKTRNSRRTVPITKELALELAPVLVGKDRGDLLFTMPDGQPVSRTFQQYTWWKIRKAAGLDGLRLHDLRHTVAALLISAGIPLTAVQRMLGHSSIKITSDLYGHLMPEVNENILATLSGALNRGIVLCDHHRGPDSRCSLCRAELPAVTAEPSIAELGGAEEGRKQRGAA